MAGEAKSYNTSDVRVKYCTEHSLRLHPCQKELQKETLAKAKLAIMVGAPEVLQLGMNMIGLNGAKKALDIGLFTGASALAWALAVGEGGSVVSMDVSDDNYKMVGEPIIQKSGVADRITIRIQPALKTLDELIVNGEAGTYGFCFIDADKENYGNYYEKALLLLAPKGIIMVDNALWSNRVCSEPKDANTVAIDALNKKMHADPRINCNLLSVGDGVMLAYKI